MWAKSGGMGWTSWDRGVGVGYREGREGGIFCVWRYIRYN